MTQLAGRKILVVEDEMLIAAELQATLEDLGCEVLGPYAQVGQALAAQAGQQIDAAVLDVNVRGEMIFPVVEALVARGVPIVLCTGYADLPSLPDSLKAQRRISKPCSADGLRRALTDVLSKPVKPGS